MSDKVLNTKVVKAKTPKAKKAPSTRWVRRKEARPQEINDAALSLFIEKGFSATRLDDVAKRAGVSKGTLYLYFSDKEALFKNVIESCMVANIANFENIVDGHEGSAEELIRNIITMMAHLVTTTPAGAIPKLVISEAGNFPNVTSYYRDEVVLRIHKFMIRIIKMGVDNGEFKPMPPAEAARSLMAPIFMMAIATHMPGFKEKLEMNPTVQAQVTLDIWLSGVKK